MSSDDAFNNYYMNQYGDDDNVYQVDDKALYYNNGQGNYNRYYNYYGNDDGNNGNNANDDGNGGNDDGNNGNDDGNNGNDDGNNGNDDGNNANNNNNNDDANGNDDGKNYDYEAPDYDDEYNKQWMDDNIDVDGFDGISISPVSCVNYNNGHMIKFEIYETKNRYQCHFSPIGTFVVSIAHFMRAYFNYQALTQGNSFSLPDDVGYLNCIPLKMQEYGFDFVYMDDLDRRLEEDEQNQQAILYAKAGCLTKGTYSSNAFQLHVYTDDKCTEAYDDGQTEQQHASRGYSINLDEYYASQLDDDDSIKYTDYPVNSLEFSTKVSFRPSFYSCQSCKPAKISDSFNKFSGNYYDDKFISQYGMTEAVYNEYLAEEEAQKQAGANCDNCQYFSYKTDDSIDDYNIQRADDYYYEKVDDDFSNVFGDDYNQRNDDGNGGNGRQLRSQEQHENKSGLVPIEKEFKKYESEFWKDINSQLENIDRSLYENVYGGVDDWNMCEQVYKYGLYCDEECQSLDAFRANQWSGADIVLLSIMCTFIAAMMILVVAKHQRSAKMIQKQQSFYSANDYDPSRSGMDTTQIPGLPPMTMFIIFCFIMVTIITLAFFNFVNETLVFAVVCCILLFIYMLKITLFSATKRPVLLASPNHEDVFGYNNAAGKDGFFS
eukprot:CAMPEP_0197173700 /NCGR_PEP_ID=MMETSP1423-20130617/527_1 /TAXON_ID=476441 /ORGANISM="Pseudo-nitzschia heimii, Strain UNC1101" /LENGTH=658 /DNA_ID=CAMNT_0042622549 /DNA_START=260 /DNA_END=2236 /DNA_ORIENTATION=-